MNFFSYLLSSWTFKLRPDIESAVIFFIPVLLILTATEQLRTRFLHLKTNIIFTKTPFKFSFKTEQQFTVVLKHICWFKKTKEIPLLHRLILISWLTFSLAAPFLLADVLSPEASSESLSLNRVFFDLGTSEAVCCVFSALSSPSFPPSSSSEPKTMCFPAFTVGVS